MLEQLALRWYADGGRLRPAVVVFPELYQLGRPKVYAVPVRGGDLLEGSFSAIASRWLRLVCLVGVLLGLFALVILRPDLEGLAALGYPGVYLIMTLSSATVFLPAPGWAVVLASSTFWNPLAVGVAAGLGAATGELTGFVAGYGSSSFFEGRRLALFERVKDWMEKNGFLTLLCMAIVPNPFFDIAGVAAGAFSYPIWKFILAVGMGNLAKYVAISLLGGAAATIWLGA